MHADVKRLRSIVKRFDGAWVRRWRDGSIWVGFTWQDDVPKIGTALAAAGFKATWRPSEKFLEIKAEG